MSIRIAIPHKVYSLGGLAADGFPNWLTDDNSLSTFLQVDTGKVFVFFEGQWYEQGV